jgi:hypothetical protein
MRASYALRLAVLVVVGVLFTGSASARAGQRPVAINSFGLWTLKRLGYGPIEFPVAGPLRFPEIPGYERRGVSRRYLLPNAARQGPQAWYLIHLHFRIVFSSESRAGRAYVGASTGAPSDLRASAQIIFKIARRGGRLWISSDSLGLVAGHRVREASLRTWTLKFDNYIPYAGVKPGLNELEFGLEQTKGVRIKRLQFFPDSGIRYSPYSPGAGNSSCRRSAPPRATRRHAQGRCDDQQHRRQRNRERARTRRLQPGRVQAAGARLEKARPRGKEPCPSRLPFGGVALG